MTPLLKQMLKKVTVGHVVAVALLLLLPLTTGFFRRPQPVEELTFVDIGALGGAPGIPDVKDLVPSAEPQPAPEPVPTPPAPTPEPAAPEAPEAKPIPEKKPDATSATKPAEKPKIKVSTNRVKRASSPQQTASTQPARPNLTAEQIRALLASGLPSTPGGALGGGGGGSGGPITAQSLYATIIRQAFYEAWDQPTDLSNPRVTVGTSIRVSRDGSIVSRRITRPSGNPVMDQSVNMALNRVSKLQPLPKELGTSFEVNVEFRLDGAF